MESVLSRGEARGELSVDRTEVSMTRTIVIVVVVAGSVFGCHTRRDPVGFSDRAAGRRTSTAEEQRLGPPATTTPSSARPSDQSREAGPRLSQQSRPVYFDESAVQAVSFSTLPSGTGRAGPKASWRCEAVASTSINAREDSQRYKISAEALKGTDRANIEIVGKTMRYFTGASFEIGSTDPAELLILHDDDEAVVAVGFDQIREIVHYVVLHKRSGLAIWSKGYADYLFFSLPHTESILFRCE
jgi:hypothetical protein